MFDLELGERVEIRVCSENREWGYNPAPDGTKGVITGFSHISYGRANGICEPGVFLNRSWPKVALESGDTITISSFHLKSFDTTPRQRLTAQERKQRDFVRELPETRFWEGDRVQLLNPEKHVTETEFYIASIQYDKLTADTSQKDVKDVHPKYWTNIYVLTNKWPTGYTMHSYGEDDLELIERGWVWKYYHDEAIEFPTLTDEANFYKSLAQVQQVKNPKTGHYGWDSLQDVLDGIEQGLGHAFSAGHGLFGGGLSHSLWRYDNESLGKRLAEFTLKEFQERR